MLSPYGPSAAEEKKEKGKRGAQDRRQGGDPEEEEDGPSPQANFLSFTIPAYYRPRTGQKEREVTMQKTRHRHEMTLRQRAWDGLAHVKLHRVTLPIWRWMRQYKRSQLSGDLIAGLVTSILLIPQGMAFAMLAGLPPVHGFYNSILPNLIYGMLGTSRECPMAALAVVSIMMNAAVLRLVDDDEVEHGHSVIDLTLKLSLLVGVVQVALGLLRVGAIVRLVSYPVVTAFTAAGSILIIISQLKYLLGVSLPPQVFAYQTIYHLAKQLPQTDMYAVILSVITLVLVYGVTWWKRNTTPTGTRKDKWLRTLASLSPILLIMVFTAVTYLLDTHLGLHVAKIGPIPRGFQLFNPLDMDMYQFTSLVPPAILIGVVSFLLSYGVTHKYAVTRGYEINSNQDLVALGASHFVGAFFGSFISAAGVARTAVNLEAGATTQLSCLVAAALVVVYLDLFGSVLYWIPTSVLAATICVSCVFTVDVPSFKEAYTFPTPDFFVLSVTMAVALLFNIDKGIITGVTLSIAFLLYRASFPRLRTLGKPEGDTEYRDVERYPEARQPLPYVKVLRVDESITFVNCQHIKHQIYKACCPVHNQESPHYCLIDASAVYDVDMTAARTLLQLHKDLLARGIQLRMGRVRNTLRDTMRACPELYEALEDDAMYLSVDCLVQHLTARAMQEHKKGGGQSEHQCAGGKKGGVVSLHGSVSGDDDDTEEDAYHYEESGTASGEGKSPFSGQSSIAG